MKRTAAEAFGGQDCTGPMVVKAMGGPAASFSPTGAALVDPKAYFAQWSQHAATLGQHAGSSSSSAPGVGVGSVKSDTVADQKTDLHRQIEEASAVRCAALVKDNQPNMNTTVAVAALRTMAMKSSFKLREELFRHPHIKRLCQRIVEILRRPPPSIPLETLSEAAWSLSQFPEEALGSDAVGVLRATGRLLESMPASDWHVNQAAKVLWTMSKADVIVHYKPLVSKVVKELVSDMGRRIHQLSHESLVYLLHAVAHARRHIKKGDLQTVHAEASDEEFFKHAASRIVKELADFDVRLLADVIHAHNEIGIRNEALFKSLCPRIVAKEKELNTKAMSRVIKAYTRFMIPLREEQQGFRTMAIVQKGDFIRPSDKPKKDGKKTFDKPVQLYEKTQVHSRS